MIQAPASRSVHSGDSNLADSMHVPFTLLPHVLMPTPSILAPLSCSPILVLGRTLEKIALAPPLLLTKICPKTLPPPLDVGFQATNEVVMDVHFEIVEGTTNVGVDGVFIEPNQIVELSTNTPIGCSQ